MRGSDGVVGQRCVDGASKCWVVPNKWGESQNSYNMNRKFWNVRFEGSVLKSGWRRNARKRFASLSAMMGSRLNTRLLVHSNEPPTNNHLPNRLSLYKHSSSSRFLLLQCSSTSTRIHPTPLLSAFLKLTQASFISPPFYFTDFSFLLYSKVNTRYCSPLLLSGKSFHHHVFCLIGHVCQYCLSHLG